MNSFVESKCLKAHYGEFNYRLKARKYPPVYFSHLLKGESILKRIKVIEVSQKESESIPYPSIYFY